MVCLCVLEREREVGYAAVDFYMREGGREIYR